jgi:hypothetical protein
MDFVIVRSFGNYVDAHIARGLLEEEGIECWLKDEHTITINPIWTQAMGGIKLMVAISDADKANKILDKIRDKHRLFRNCPACGSNNLELVSTPRKASNWLTALLSFFFGDYAIAPDKVWHCFDCGHETEHPVVSEAGYE